MNTPPSALSIAVACDSRYVTGAIGTLASVRLAVPLETDLEVIFLHDGLAESEKERVLTAMARLRNGPVVRFILMDEAFAAFPYFYFGSKMTYARLLLPQILSIDRLIYIDVDVLVLKDISQLSDIELPKKGMAGVPEEVKPTMAEDRPEEASLEWDPLWPNLNGGVMVLDLEKVRKSGLFTKAFEILRNYPDSCRWHDQSAVNYALAGGAKVLDQAWNKQTHRACYDPVAGIPDLAARGLNIHFVSKAKPWLAFSPFPAEIMFCKLLDAVDPKWKEDPHAKAIRARAKERYAAVLPAFFTVRAFFKKLIGKDGGFDLRAAKIWEQFNRDLSALKERTGELGSLYEGWQKQIEATLKGK